VSRRSVVRTRQFVIAAVGIHADVWPRSFLRWHLTVTAGRGARKPRHLRLSACVAAHRECEEPRAVGLCGLPSSTVLCAHRRVRCVSCEGLRCGGRYMLLLLATVHGPHTRETISPPVQSSLAHEAAAGAERASGCTATGTACTPQSTQVASHRLPRRRSHDGMSVAV
jgi:hypothetical protein